MTEWKYEKAFYSEEYVVKYAVTPRGHSKPIARVANEEHARFIAAAPELLECLKEGEDIVSGLEAECDNAGIGDLVEIRDWWRKALMIIAKAEGTDNPR